MSRAATVLMLIAGMVAVPSAPASADAPGVALRPEARPDVTVTNLPPDAEGIAVTENEIPPGFDDWVAAFRPRAERQGIDRSTLDEALAEVTYLPRIIELDRNQNEFTRTVWDYLSLAVSEARIANGRARLEDHAETLTAIEARYGVDRHVVTAIWGLESAYGAVRGDTPILSALATLAFDGRRGAFFEGELLAALRILQSGQTTPANMRGSWAGAMGHTQFMPTSYERLAVDFTGDGRRDIWGEDPTDALASTAAYLANAGWVTGQPWGVEVVLPDGFDYRLADRRVEKSPDAWAALGVRDVTGAEVPDHGTATILLPGGHQGAAFMIFANFGAIERYNTADAYVIAVGHLADRLRGGPPVQSDWPDDRSLTGDERRELQRLLTEAGYSTQGIDGLVGPNTINAVRDWQDSQGLVPDGYPSPGLVQMLRDG